MSTQNEILEFRLFGDNISPEVFKSREVGAIIISIEESLRAYILTHNPEIKEEDLFISLVDIGHESNSLRWRPNLNILTTAYIALSLAIVNNDFTNWPKKSIDNIHDIQKVIRAKNCEAELKVNGEKLANLSADSDISVPSSHTIIGESIIYGKIMRVGGAEPRVRIKLEDSSPLILEIDEDLAIRLAQKLYRPVGFRGTATWTKLDYRLIDFKVSDIIDKYDPTTNKEAFAQIRDIIGDDWDKIEDIKETLLID